VLSIDTSSSLLVIFILLTKIMSMELLCYGNLPLTVILKSVQVLSSFLGEKDETFMSKIGIKNKKLYSKMRVIQLAEWKKSLDLFREIYTNLNIPSNIEEFIVLTRCNTIIQQIKSDINQLLIKFRNKLGNNEITEILVNVLIPKEKWIELNSSNINKLVSFYYNIFDQTFSIENFEKFLLMNQNYSKYIKYFSSKLHGYYYELLFDSQYMRKDICKALIFKSNYEDLFRNN
jgi:hypothetical protein